MSVAVVLQPTPPAHALLTAGDPIKNASAILRYALPINNKPIRQVQVRQICYSFAGSVPLITVWLVVGCHGV
jgi:hypothetical protein